MLPSLIFGIIVSQSRDLSTFTLHQKLFPTSSKCLDSTPSFLRHGILQKNSKNVSILAAKV